MMVAVADTSPIILLSKVGRLSLLTELYGAVLVPPAVRWELLAKPDAVSPELEQFVKDVETRAAGDRRLVQDFSADLGDGEAEAIVLASEIPDALLIMDDDAGRRLARELGTPVTGLLGVLTEAKSRGAIPAIRPLLDHLMVEGFWLSEAMRQTVLDCTGE